MQKLWATPEVSLLTLPFQSGGALRRDGAAPVQDSCATHHRAYSLPCPCLCAPCTALRRSCSLLFALLHVANHLAALCGVDAHISLMNLLRVVYRQPLIEALLLFGVTVQVVSGLGLVRRSWASIVGPVARLQAVSGVYLALFLLIHVSAVLVGRSVLGLNTNFYFAAAGFHVAPFAWFFAPYYSLAILALFAHVGCALYWQLRTSGPERARMCLAGAVIAGAVASLAITLSLAGKLQPVNVPAEYTAPYGPK